MCNILSREAGKKKAAILKGRFLKQFPGSYFGGGVVEVEPFLDFLPLWWPLCFFPLFPVSVEVVPVFV
jgi:hypothetical protein